MKEQFQQLDDSTPNPLIRTIVVASSGNLVEWFDFYVYAFSALYFAGAFFPKSDPTVQLLNTAGVFAAGFLMRPIGGWLFGRIADKWTLLVLEELEAKGTLRFTEIGRLVEGISQKMLTQTLRDLQRDGFVARQVFDTKPPSVEYRLTPLGQSLIVPFGHLIEWANASIPDIRASRTSFDATS